MVETLVKLVMLRYFDSSYLLLFCAVLFGASAVAQTGGVNENRLWVKADRLLESGDYLAAIDVYKQITPENDDDAVEELNYKLGVCHFEIRGYQEESKKYFERVSAELYLETNYYLAQLYHKEGKFDKAIFYYNTYKEAKGFKAYSNKEVNVLIEKSEIAREFVNNKDNSITIKNLGPEVNSEYPEYAPLIPADGSVLLFTSRRKNDVWTAQDAFGEYFEDVYTCSRSGDTWGAATMLDTNINKSVHDAGTGLSQDGKKLLLFRTSQDLKSGSIYECELTGDKWSDPIPLGSIVNSEDYAETSACYAPEGDVIFFSSDRPGGYGGKDLYMVRKLPNGEWGIPYNLGPSVNTPYNEDAPFVHPSGSVLYYSSEGHQNMGGYDVFKSSFGEDGQFTAAENLGCPINTVNDDVFFVLNADASRGYISSHREGGYGSHDIYEVNFENNTVPLHVYNVIVKGSNGELISKVDMVLTEVETEQRFGKYKSNKQSGKMVVISPQGKKYKVTIKASGYESKTQELVLGAEHNLEFTLTPK